MTLIEKLEQRGYEKGIERGIGKGEINVVSKQLRTKFKDEAEDWIEKLQDLPPDKLEEIAERIITEDSLSAIFKGFVH
ncbi:MAG: hypothetical protein GY866_28090 [Proteobacteria bacterium]|nr:hypothetical protein [Pseudomonadota bacterium]